MSKVLTKWITDDAVTKEKLNADVAGEGLRQQTGTSALEVMVHNPVDVDHYLGNIALAVLNALVVGAGTLEPGDAYVMTDAGNTTEGTPLAVVAGDLIEFDGTSWVKIVSAAGGFPPVGTRALAGGASGVALIAPLVATQDETKVCIWDGTSLTPAFSADNPLTGDLANVIGSGAFHEKSVVQLSAVVPTGDWETQIGKLANAASASDADELPILINGKEYRVTRAELLAGAVTEQKIQEMIKITAGDITAGYFSLANNPVNKGCVSCTPVGGPQQINYDSVGATGATPDFDLDDFSTTPKRVKINSDGTDGSPNLDIAANMDWAADDIVIVEYEI